MNNCRYVVMRDHEHAEAVQGMMRDLYAHDAAEGSASPTRFSRTVDRLLASDATGRIVLFLIDGNVQGYSLLIPYWSNEFGGTLLYIDELYVAPQFRGRGIGGGLIRLVESERPYQAVALALEVGPTNAAARKLYERLGFSARKHGTMTRTLS